jgi:hypothetical protein
MPIVLKKKKPLPAPSNQLEQPGAVIDFPAAAALPNVELSEDAVAEAFAQTYLDTLRFDHTRGKWFVWNGPRWCRNNTGLAFDYARKICRKYRKDHLRMSSKKAAEGVELMRSAISDLPLIPRFGIAIRSCSELPAAPST